MSPDIDTKRHASRTYALLSLAYATQAKVSEFGRDDALLKSMAAGLRSREILSQLGFRDDTLPTERQFLIDIFQGETPEDSAKEEKK